MSQNDIKFAEVVKTLEAIESTTQRTVMTKYLSILFRKTPPAVIDKVIYFILGELKPEWQGIELGIGEKLTMKALANATGLSIKQIEDMYKKFGDLGEVAKKATQMKTSKVSEKGTILSFLGAKTSRELTMNRVYDTLMQIARATGEGSQDLKVRLLASLFADAKPEEAKYIARFIVGKLRLGVADMTILDALSDVFKVKRDVLEKAYHVHPDLGYIAKKLATEGPSSIEKIRIKPGVPVQPMLAERLSTANEILTKLGGLTLCEYKYDGERAQIHKFNGKIKIFSRRLEDITHAYPDVVKYVNEAVQANEFIIEVSIENLYKTPIKGGMTLGDAVGQTMKKSGVSDFVQNDLEPLELISSADPTNNNSMTKWLAMQYINPLSNFRVPEDVNQVKQDLTKYLKLKKLLMVCLKLLKNQTHLTHHKMKILKE